MLQVPLTPCHLKPQLRECFQPSEWREKGAAPHFGALACSMHHLKGDSNEARPSTIVDFLRLPSPPSKTFLAAISFMHLTKVNLNALSSTFLSN